MKSINLSLFSPTLLSPCSSRLYRNENLKIWYEKPASFWVEALFLGNGQFKVMIYGVICCVLRGS